jgi:hypothetical protein
MVGAPDTPVADGEHVVDEEAHERAGILLPRHAGPVKDGDCGGGETSSKEFGKNSLIRTDLGVSSE